MANINSVITYNANLSPAQAQIKALTGQVGALSAAFNTLDKSALSAQRSLAATFAANVGQIGGFTAQTVKATTAVETFGKQIAANRLTMREYFREAFTGYARQNSMLRQLAAQQVRYEQSVAIPTGPGQAMLMTPQSINAASSAAQLASQRFSIFNQLVNGGATAMLNWGKNTQWAGRQLMVGFTLPLALFAGVMSKQFRELDKELTRFQKVYGSDLGNAVSESTQKMREQVQQLAYDISSAYGIAAKETAALAADIAATGAEGEQLMASVQQTTRLAVLGEVDRQEAMKATLSLQSAFRLNTNELAESINFLNAVENQTSATLEDLSIAIPKVGPVIRSLGGDVKDLATLLVAMREGGIPAAEAANALKSGLASLINPTKQASEVAKQFGVDLVGIVEANRGQLMPTIFAMQDALNGLDSFSRSRIIEQIFGKYQFARISALFDNIGRTGSQTQQVIELATRSSAELAAVANGEIRTLTESTAVKFQRTLEQLKNALMPIGQALTETLIPVFEKVGQGLKAFSTFFSALPDSIQGLAKWAVALTAIAGPVIMLVGLFGNLIANGLKFGMMIVRIGARIAGLKTEKFELLNSDVMAAKLGVDNLTTSFVNQETAMNRLVGVMSAYEASLRRLTISNPALFIPGAVPGPRGAVPIRRQAGSTRPEFVPGSGRGDKIPAMLEPGEFIVNRAATEKYAPVLMQMNRGTLPGFINGTEGPLGGTGGKKIVTPEGVVYFRKQQSKDDRYQWRYSRPSGLENLSGADQARMHLASTGGEAKNLIIRTRQAGSQYLAWLDSLFIIGNQFQNQFENLAVGSGQNARSIQQNVTEALRNNNVSQDQIDRIITNLANGVLQHEQDLVVYKSALERMSTAGLNDRTLDQLSGLRLAMQNNPEVLTGSNPQQIRGAIQTNLSSLTQIRSIMNTPEFRNATTAGQLETKALLQEARASIITATKNLMTQLTQLSGQAGIDVSSVIAQMLAEIPEDLRTELMRSIDANSPSRRIQPAAKEAGKSLGDGAVIGLQEGLKQSTAGRRIVAGPVSGGGIESISNAQKIAQADQSILRLKTLQQKFTADRVRAEVELGVLDDRLFQIRNSETMTAQEKLRATLALNQERIALEKTHQTALENETRIQNIINGHKQRIADADAAQARSEQEEARNAARRATASMVSPGGVYGPGGYNVFGTVGRKDTSPGPTVPVTPTSTGPGRTIKNSQDQAMGMRGGGVMNAAFMASMAMSSVAMLGGASSDAAAKIGLFSTALMTATMLMQSVSAKGMFTNFLGMGSLGKKASVTGRAMNIAAGGASRGGAALMGLGRGLSLLGGPVGIAAGIGITAAIAGFMAYRNAAEEARERAVAAFNDPVKSAEYFGEVITNVSDIFEKNRLSNISEDLQGIDKALREAVSQDYAPLIEQIKFLSAGAGAQQLSVAYSNMILSGMSAENAKTTIEAIAAEAGTAGGEAFTEALSKGMLSQELTIEKAIDNIVGQFRPGETKVGSEGLTLLQTINKDIEDTQKRIDEITASAYTPTSPTGGAGQTTYGVGSAKELEDLINKLDQLKDRLEDLTTVNPELIPGVLDSLVMAYQQDPTAAMEGLQDFTNIISELADGDKAAALNKITDYLQNVYGAEWEYVSETIDTQEEKILALQMATAGISLDKAINDAGEFDTSLARAVVTAKSLADATKLLRIEAEEEYFSMIGDFAQKQRDQINLDFENFSNAMETRIELYEGLKEGAQESFEAEQEARQDSIDGMQDEMDQRRRAFDEEMQRLDDRKNAIEKSSEAYINSLEKNQKAESFYAQQRKTAFGALEKLASGDVFGFLQERQQMSTDAQEFSYDEMISGIEERRDLELDAIDEVRQQKEREQEEYEQMMEDRIQSVQDLMEIEQEAHDDRMAFYDKQIEGADTLRDNRLKAKDEEIDGIKNMEQDYRDNSTRAEETYSKKYAELKTAPYVEARKEMLRLRIEEIYYRGGVTLATAAVRAGALSTQARGRSAAMGIEEVLKDLGFINRASDIYRTENVGDTGVGDTQAVRDMTVTADTVTINGGGTNTPGRNNDGSVDGDGDPTTSLADETAATGGYIQNGRVNLQDGGGAVSGPGGPKSDVIPAMLSNGEYVIQASSVNKYGTDLMHSINAGKFATGGFVTADRAEQNATGTRGRPKPQYSGGTPTYSGGYTSANKQASYIPGVTRPKKVNAPSFKEEVSSIVNSVRSGLATAFDAVATGFIPPWMRTSENTTTGIGRFIGGSQYGNSSAGTKALLAMGLIPAGRGGYSRTSHMTDITGLTGIIGQGAKAVGGGAEGRGFYTAKFKKLVDMYQEGSVKTPWRGLGDFVISGGSKDANIYRMSLEERSALDATGVEGFDALTKSLRAQGYQAMQIPFTNGSTMVKYIADDIFSPSHIIYQGSEGLIRRKVPDLMGADPIEIVQALGISPSKARKSFQNRFGSHIKMPPWMQLLMEQNKFADGGLVAPEKGLTGILSLLGGEGNSRRIPGQDTGGATGTPLFDQNVLSNLGVSLSTAQSVLGYLDSGGWPKDLHRLAWTIAMRESGGNPKLYHDHINNPDMYSPGNGDYGLFQINKRAYGSQPWFNTQKLLDGAYNSSIAYQHISRKGSTFLPWALLKTYNGSSAGFDWSSYGGRPSWGGISEKNTNALWPAFLGYRGGTNPSTTPANGGDGGLAVAFAKQQLGEPYVVNGDGPNQWDCSGLTAAAYNVGVPDGYKKYSLISYSTDQANRLNVTSRRTSGSPGDGSMPNLPNNFNIGDILYFTNTGLGSSGKHVSLYAGNGQVIEAGDPVQLNPLNNTFNRKYFNFGGAPIPKFASGGFISGPGGPKSDLIPAMLSNGEYVVKASSVAKYGKGFMDQLNSGQLSFGGGGIIPRYADGGMIGNASSPSFNMPEVSNSSVGVTNNNYAGNISSNNNKTNVKVVINGAGGKNANVIANKVISMINSANNRRDHSRSI